MYGFARISLYWFDAGEETLLIFSFSGWNLCRRRKKPHVSREIRFFLDRRVAGVFCCSLEQQYSHPRRLDRIRKVSNLSIFFQIPFSSSNFMCFIWFWSPNIWTPVFRVQLQKVLSQGYDDSSWPLQDKRGRYGIVNWSTSLITVLAIIILSCIVYVYSCFSYSSLYHKNVKWSEVFKKLYCCIKLSWMWKCCHFN